jgi:hypothetical protein
MKLRTTEAASPDCFVLSSLLRDMLARVECGDADVLVYEQMRLSLQYPVEPHIITRSWL